MNIVIVADIFGKTKHLESLANALSGQVQILDPYQGRDMGFKNEAQAYEYFNQQVGNNKYTDELKVALSLTKGLVYLIGFSVGATAVWNVSGLASGPYSIVGGTCFYGSKIRENTHINPTFPISLIWPESEGRFSIPELIDTLSGKHNVMNEQTESLHGFMNGLSSNYNEKAAAYHWNSIKAHLMSIQKF